ncbi:hypothetical protein EBR96_09555, partial [bacterium]|nr:hypothetical protein [bacterium]
RIPISGDFQALLRLATRLYELSDGAWDGTVVGQGPVGFWMIEFGPGYVTKKQNNITLSLDSIAQGYTVDLVVSELVRLGATSAVAELGGEVRVFSSDQRPFRINVALPDTDYQQFSGQITLTNAAAATTGIEKGVIKVLDPQNRRPKPTNFQSIIVVAPTGAIADGLSTTLWALHPGKWTGVLTEFENVSVYVIQNDGQLKKW